MQLVAALDSHANIRPVLGLFERVVTGADDGYGRMADKPAATLLHLGPGLSNGLANLHNARRAGSPIIILIGDHATYHLHYDAPLTSDAAAVARPMSDWVRTSRSSRDLPQAGAETFAQAIRYPEAVASLIIPADHAWNGGWAAVSPHQGLAVPIAPDTIIEQAAAALRNAGPTALYLGGRALRADALQDAGRIAAATGAGLVCETFPARLQRGAGRVALERLPYLGEQAADALKDFVSIVFVGAEPPVSFFAYPDKPSSLLPSCANLVRLASVREDAAHALAKLAVALDAPPNLIMFSR